MPSRSAATSSTTATMTISSHYQGANASTPSLSGNADAFLGSNVNNASARSSYQQAVSNKNPPSEMHNQERPFWGIPIVGFFGQRKRQQHKPHHPSNHDCDQQQQQQEHYEYLETKTYSGGCNRNDNNEETPLLFGSKSYLPPDSQRVTDRWTNITRAAMMEHRYQQQHQQTLPMHSLVTTTTTFSSSMCDTEVTDRNSSTGSFQDVLSQNSALESRCRHRSGAELWAVLRHHVQCEDFHIRHSVRFCNSKNDNGKAGNGGPSNNSNNKSLNKKRGSRVSFLQRRTSQEDDDGDDGLQFDQLDLPYDFSVMDCAIALAVYLAISVIAFSYVFEHWTVIDSMYYAVVTFTTIGYGDLSPSTPGGRLFCVFFALTGVAVLAIALGVVGSKIIEGQVSTISAAQDTLAQNILNVFHRHHRRQKGCGQERTNDQLERQRTALLRDKERRDKFSGAIDDDDSSLNRSFEHTSSFSYLSDFDDPVRNLQEELLEAVDPCHSTATACQLFAALLIRYIPALTPLVLGAAFIGYYEGWSWIDAIYYCVVTTCTIGYGDLTPQRQSMRMFAVFFIPLAVGAMGHFLGTVANFIMEQRSRVMDKRLWKHELTTADLRTITRKSGEFNKKYKRQSSCGSYDNASDTDPDDDDNPKKEAVVTELDFVIFMLTTMKKVDMDLIDQIRHHFHRLDVTGSGTLVRADLELLAHRKLRSARSKLRLRTYKQQLYRQSSSHIRDEDSNNSNDGSFRNMAANIRNGLV